MVHYPPYTAEQRLFVYLKKENGEFYPLLKRQFQMKFNRPSPCQRSCFDIHHKIKFSFSAHNRPKSGRRRTARTEENITMVVGDVMTDGYSLNWHPKTSSFLIPQQIITSTYPKGTNSGTATRLTATSMDTSTRRMRFTGALLDRMKWWREQLFLKR